MEKVAQKRRLRHKLRELINVPGERVEELLGMYSPQLKELMELMREVDDNAREQATDLKNLLKLATTNFNRREYMIAVAYLGQFHDKLEGVNEELSKLKHATDVAHHEFLFGDVDKEYVDYLINKLSPKLEKRRLSRKPAMPSPLSRKRAFLVSEAGISDWWANITTERGKALRAWEKRFPKQAKELKRQVDMMIKRSDAMLDFLLDTFKSLGSFRATRDLEEYIKATEKLKQKYNNYDANFASFYDTYVKNFVDFQKEKATKELGVEQAPMEGVKLPVTPTTNKQLPAEPVRQLTQPVAPQEPTTERGIDEKWMQAEQAKNVVAPKVQPQAKKPLAVLDLPQSSGPFAKASPRSELLTEHDIGSTLRSPLVPATLKEQEVELSHIPDTDETTLVSPQMDATPRDKPIQVSMVPSGPTTQPELTPPTMRSRIAFLEKLDKLAGQSDFAVAAELIKYAETIKQEEPEISQKLLQLSKSMLKE